MAFADNGQRDEVLRGYGGTLGWAREGHALLGETPRITGFGGSVKTGNRRLSRRAAAMDTADTSKERGPHQRKCHHNYNHE